MAGKLKEGASGAADTELLRPVSTTLDFIFNPDFDDCLERADDDSSLVLVSSDTVLDERGVET